MPRPFIARESMTPLVAEIALDMAGAGDLDHFGLARLAATMDGRPDVGGLTPLSLATAHLRGLLDEEPSDLVIVVALGLTSAATGVLGSKLVAAAQPEDDDDETLLAAASM